MLVRGIPFVMLLLVADLALAQWVFPNDYDYPDYAANGPPQRPRTNSIERAKPTRRPKPTSTTTPGTTTTALSLRLFRCLQVCPKTSEYNPVCGTDGQNYSNKNVMRCAQQCGVNVKLARIGPCTVPRT